MPDGNRMRQKPTLVLVHGGPGADHAGYKPAFSALSDCAQIVYFDNRGDGRSDRGPKDCWTLAQWADDLHGLCEALSIERPIVYGASFGGMVAMSYAIRRAASIHLQRRQGAGRIRSGLSCASRITKPLFPRSTSQ